MSILQYASEWLCRLIQNSFTDQTLHCLVLYHWDYLTGFQWDFGHAVTSLVSEYHRDLLSHLFWTFIRCLYRAWWRDKTCQEQSWACFDWSSSPILVYGLYIARTITKGENWLSSPLWKPSVSESMEIISMRSYDWEMIRMLVWGWACGGMYTAEYMSSAIESDWDSNFSITRHSSANFLKKNSQEMPARVNEYMRILLERDIKPSVIYPQGNRNCQVWESSNSI